MRKSRFIKIATNKYILAVIFFIVWMAFFDPKDWGLISSRNAKLNQLHESEQTMHDQIAATRTELSQLTTNAETIEKYAREKYYMKKDNEEIFIIKHAESKK